MEEEKDINELIGEYGELLERYGVESDEAKEFRERYSEKQEFTDLSRVADRLRETHTRHTGLTGKQALFIGTVMSFVVGVVIVVWVAFGVYTASSERSIAAELTQQSLKLIHSQGVADSYNETPRTRKIPMPSLAKLPEDLELINQLWIITPDESKKEWSPENLYLATKAAYLGGREDIALERMHWIQRERPNSKIHYFEAVLAESSGDVVKAQKAYEKAIDLNQQEMEKGEPSFPVAYNNLAMLSLRQSLEHKPYDMELLNKAYEQIQAAIAIAEQSDKLKDDRLFDTQGQIYEAVAETKEQGEELEHFEGLEGLSRKGLLRLAQESYRTAQLYASSSRRDEYTEIIAELEAKIER
ncbi:hypothetical protein MYX65_03225 [Acidobacteria bacterium AH-259-L09]|nr:hypothetical protein [Acidobacteria bacterium AH-259-L09]